MINYDDMFRRIYMLPYYSCPFSYLGRNSAMMQQQPVPYVMPSTQQPGQLEQVSDDKSMMSQMPQMYQMPQMTQMPQMPQEMQGMQQSPTFNQPYNMAPATQMQPMMQQMQPMMQTMPMQQMQQTMPMQQNAYPNYMPNMYGTGMGSGYAPHAESPEDRVPVLSNNPPVTSISLFKELTAYPNYGNPSGNADILYTGDRGTWTFDIPAFLFVPGQLTNAEIIIRGVLDDMNVTPADRYSARITVNGSVVHTGRVPLEHGRPLGAQFNNWRELRFRIPNIRRNNRVVIENTSNARPNDWIAFDWMELRVSPRR
jgi:hypothetical protein